MSAGQLIAKTMMKKQESRMNVLAKEVVDDAEVVWVRTDEGRLGIYSLTAQAWIVRFDGPSEMRHSMSKLNRRYLTKEGHEYLAVEA